MAAGAAMPATGSVGTSTREGNQKAKEEYKCAGRVIHGRVAVDFETTPDAGEFQFAVCVEEARNLRVRKAPSGFYEAVRRARQPLALLGLGRAEAQPLQR
jgi:hypothetical protein